MKETGGVARLRLVAAIGFAQALVLLAAATPVIACVPAGGPRPTPAYFAQHLVASAASIDIVTLESERRLDPGQFARGLFGDGREWPRYSAEAYKAQLGLVQEYQPTRFTFKVVESLKGRGSKRFQLTGVGPDSDGATQSLAPSSHGAMLDVEATELEPRNLSPGTCLSFPAGRMGGRFVVFRDSRGKLVGSVAPWRGERRGGPSYAAIRSGHDPWLREIRRALDAKKVQRR